MDWALSMGANGLEMDMRFDSGGTPSEFKHGGVCDCICWTGTLGDHSGHVCSQLVMACSAESPVADHLRHIASKSSQVAAIIIDSKVDDLSEAAQKAAGTAVVQLLTDALFSKGYKGFAVVSAPKWAYSAYLLAAVEQAKNSPYIRQIYFGVDQDNGGTHGAGTTLNHLWRNVGSPRVVYGSGTSSCLRGMFYAETMLAEWHQATRRVRLVDVWTLDKADSMKEYILLGPRDIDQHARRPGYGCEGPRYEAGPTGISSLAVTDGQRHCR